MMITTALVMVTLTLWGEGRREKAAKEVSTAAPKTVAAPESAPVPVPVPDVVTPAVKK